MTDANAFQVRRRESGVVELIFDLPGEKVNKLGASVLRELDGHLAELSGDGTVTALIIRSGKDNIFIAGADLGEISSLTESADAAAKSREGQALMNKLASLPFPTVAVIDGAALGGGLELALACDFRIATENPKCSLGLPEVNLGIIPGFGGTQRLPRLVGLMRGLKMILGGKAIDGKAAIRSKLVDACVPREFLDSKTDAFVEEIISERGRQKVLARRNSHPWRRFFSESNPLARMVICRAARKSVMKKTRGQYPAPLAALDVVGRTVAGSLEAGLRLEAQEFGKLAVTDTCKNLIQLFFIGERLKKGRGVKGDIREARKVRTAAVVGAGVMGGGIAWLFSKRDVPVRLKDINWDAIAKGYAAAAGTYKTLMRLRKVDKREAVLKMHHISGAIAYTGFGSVDLVVEAVVENIDIKRKVFAQLEEVLPVDAVLASNTSTLSIDDMCEGMQHPERFVGMHFFNPVSRMPLVEVIPGERTSDDTVARTVACAIMLGKTPVVVKSCPGFLVNRILIPYLNEAIKLVEEGSDGDAIDRLLLSFGMPMGPLRLIDEIGLDVACKAGGILRDAYGERMSMALLATILYEEQKLLGKKGGAGFFIYGEGRPSYNSDMSRLSAIARDRSGTTGTTPDVAEIIDRCILMMVNEAARCMDEEIVAKPEYLDMAMIMGTGFPAFRGGLLRYADSRGVANVVSSLERLADSRGDRFRPCDRLRDMSQNNERFRFNEIQ